MSVVTVHCNVTFQNEFQNANDGIVHFTYEDIPIKLYFYALADVSLTKIQ
jgi:hypothetical protein